MTTEREEIAEHPRADEAHQDGIGEEDNAIPAWWWWSFFATVVFAAFYTPYFILGGWSQQGQYAEQVARAQAVAASMPKVTTNPFRGDAVALAEGKQVFETICAACHKPDGSGLVGPSLVDPYWKYGHTDAELFETVSKGRPAGMPAWEAQLGADKIWKSLVYLESLPRSDVPGLGAPVDGTPAPAASAAPTGG
jgi:cytochrome c oxidase cbb3-type subunit 3